MTTTPEEIVARVTEDTQYMGTPAEARAALAAATAKWRAFRQPLMATAKEHRKRAAAEQEARFRLAHAAALWLWHEENSPEPEALLSILSEQTEELKGAEEEIEQLQVEVKQTLLDLDAAETSLAEQTETVRKLRMMVAAREGLKDALGIDTDKLSHEVAREFAQRAIDAETALSESREREKVLEAGLLTISTAPCYGDASDSQTLSAVINFAGDALTPKPLGGEA